MADINTVKYRLAKTLALVPKGNVVSYGQLADLCGFPGRARMVGKCLKILGDTHNWHRVVRADGKIAFPKTSEQGIEQIARLRNEGVAIKSERVRIKDVGWQPDLYIILRELKY